jgi:TIR domain/SIR2-like domain
MASPEAIAGTVEHLWDEDIWEELLAYIEAGRVIPIVGPACYLVEAEGRQQSVDAFIAERLARKLALPAAELPASPSLNDVVSLHLRKGRRREALYPRIRGIVQEANLPVPRVLQQLAEIRSFNLFVTTAFDPLLETAINQVRFGGEPRTRTIAHVLNDKCDLDASKNALTRPVVYHLFGKLSPLPSYAICDEDLLEWFYTLQSESHGPEKLLDELEGNHLLIIGSNFGDWLARMFLRTTRRRRRLSDPREVLEVLADDRLGKDPGLVAFLANFSRRTQVFEGGAAEFVDRLWHECRQRFGDAAAALERAWIPPPSEMPDRAIFISYAREDLDAVRRLKNGLDEAGLSVWFDFDQLAGGDTFDRKIRDNIQRCNLFLPVLSANTEARPEGYFRREWHYALDRDLAIDSGTPFLVPVALHDPTAFNAVPPRFRQVHITNLVEGRPTADFVAQLKRLAEARR